MAFSLIDAHAGALGTIGAAATRHRFQYDGDRRRHFLCHLALCRPDPACTAWGPYDGALLPDQWLLEAGTPRRGRFSTTYCDRFPLTKAPTPTIVAHEPRLTGPAGGQHGSGTDARSSSACNVLGNRAPLADPTLRAEFPAGPCARMPTNWRAGTWRGCNRSHMQRDTSSTHSPSEAAPGTADRFGRQRAKSAPGPDACGRARNTDRGAA